MRRLWECPACRRREWTGGQIVTRRCDCRAREDPPQFTWMRLVEEPPKRPRKAEPPTTPPPESQS